MSIDHALRNLRHLYEQMIAGHVRNTQSAATGLLGPAIEQIEKEQARDVTPEQVAHVFQQSLERISMRIYTLWHKGDDDEAPWIIDAVDEYTLDNNGEFPPPYLQKREDVHVRELIINVPEKAVRELFDSPGVTATVVKE